MSWTVPVVLYGWLPLVAIAFATLTPTRAVLVSYFAGWMFLPVTSFQAFGFFDYSKDTIVPLSVLAGVLLFDSARLARFRPNALDLPIALFCAAPFFTSLHNELGVYDGLSGAAYHSIAWGLPYLTGRLYFWSHDGVRRLALAFVAAGLVYMPLCWYELRMSPQLHALVYGFHQHDWLQTLRGGGYRPMVFMNHGLMTGLWMAAAALVAFALWTSGAWKRVWGVRIGLACLALVVTVVACKSAGAVALLAAGAAALWSMRALRTSVPMLLFLLAPPAYVAVRASGAWTGVELADLAGRWSAERAGSLSFRLKAEERLRERAAEQALFGWGGWNRSAVRRSDDPRSEATVTVDSLWILVFGKYGAFGLVSLLAIWLAPLVALWRRAPPRRWPERAHVWAWTLALVLVSYELDNLVNAMSNPVYLLAAGGIAGFALAPARATAPVERVPATWPRAVPETSGA